MKNLNFTKMLFTLGLSPEFVRVTYNGAEIDPRLPIEGGKLLVEPNLRLPWKMFAFSVAAAAIQSTDKTAIYDFLDEVTGYRSFFDAGDEITHKHWFRIISLFYERQQYITARWFHEYAEGNVA